jgi:mRNA interferase RelE/StbE
MPERFHVCLVPGAQKDFKELDGSMKPIVLKYLNRLKENADTMGEPLRNDQEIKLAGCRKLKLREAGIRIIYRIVDEKVEVLGVILDVVTILAIEKREDLRVYRIAQGRLEKTTGMGIDDYNTAIKQTLETFQRISDQFEK